MTFIDWETLDLKKSSGKEKLRCPACDGQRTDKKDKSLLVNISQGYGKCFYCDALTFRDKNEVETEYKVPSQEWKNHTKLSDNVVKWFEKDRGINQSTLKALKITQEKYYQPALSKEVSNVVFNYFERETLVNKKYRSGNKKFTQSAGTKSIFYNINSIINEEECWIVEGEMDVLSLHQIGINNVISVPNGANDNDDYWKNSKDYLEDIKRFVIAVDNDEKGNILKDKIAHRLGKYRCEYIDWVNKDANGDLIAGIIRETVLNKKRFPVSGTFTIDDLKGEVINLYENGLPKTIYPKAPCFGNLKNIFSTMFGHVVTGTGIPSHGKSTFIDWYVLNLINDYKLKASWFSPEHTPMSLYQANLIEKVTGRNFWGKIDGEQVPRISKEGIDEYSKWAREKIYLTDCGAENLPTWDWLLDKFKEQVYAFGINIFVIDAFNKVILPKGNKIDAINSVLTKLTHFARSNNVIVFLVAHPTKMSKNEDGVYNIPTLYDCSGSADFRNQTHDGFTIYRYFEDLDEGEIGRTVFHNMKTKFSFQGKMLETEEFQYCKQNGRYYANGVEPLYNMIGETKEEIPKMEYQDGIFDGVEF